MLVNASRVFNAISGKGLLPDCFSYTTIIAGYCNARDMNKAFHYVGKMLKSGIKPSVTTYSFGH